jgi:hypothetical protein
VQTTSVCRRQPSSVTTSWYSSAQTSARATIVGSSSRAERCFGCATSPTTDTPRTLTSRLWMAFRPRMRLLQLHRWPDIPEDAGIEGYALDEVTAEKLRCIAERQQCRDLFDMHELLDGNHVDALEAWELYLRKAAHDVARGRQRTSPREWSTTFSRRMESYKRLWDEELGEYLTIGRRPVWFGLCHRSARRVPVVRAQAGGDQVLSG